MPGVLTSSASQGMLSENMELLKAVMCAPAVVLYKGTKAKIFNASCEEVRGPHSHHWSCQTNTPLKKQVLTLPPTEPVRVLRAYELPYLNLSTQIAHYRLRADGALVLVDTGRIQCTMCHIPDRLDVGCLRPHLESRRHAIRKLLRDRRIVVELGQHTSVYSCETLQLGKRVIPSL